MKKVYYAWEDILEHARMLLKRLEDHHYDALLAVTRGGMVPGALLAEALGIRNVLTAAVMLYDDTERAHDEPHFLQFPVDALILDKRVLVVDDVWDSGRTAVAVRERVRAAGGIPEVAVLHFKPKNNAFPGDGPDHYAIETEDWIVYPWDPEAWVR